MRIVWICGIADSVATMIAPRRRGDSIKRIAAGQDDLGHRRMSGEPGVGGLQLGVGQHAAVGTDMFAPEAEPAIDRADQQRLQQCPVRVAMHHALDRGQRVVADRVGVFVRRGQQFGSIGDELPPDRIVRRLDQRPHRRGNSDRVARLGRLHPGNARPV